MEIGGKWSVALKADSTHWHTDTRRRCYTLTHTHSHTGGRLDQKHSNEKTFLLGPPARQHTESRNKWEKLWWMEGRGQEEGE